MGLDSYLKELTQNSKLTTQNSKMRILAIDYGTKRCGIAVTDELKLIASALATVETTELLDFLQQYCQAEPVERIIVGLPKQVSGELSESETAIATFIEKLQEKLPEMPVSRYDERFTSKIASHILVESGTKKKKRQDKALLDRISATLILQDYLSSL
jgi:RNAse H domain protein, YqgF family